MSCPISSHWTFRTDLDVWTLSDTSIEVPISLIINMKNKEYKFHLEKYHGPGSRHKCPKCGDRSSFVLYVDDNGIPIDNNVGRCNHESSCGYHYSPSQYFKDNCMEPKDSPFRHLKDVQVNKTIVNAALAPSFIDASLVINSLSQNSTFVDFLKGLIKDDDLVNHLCMAYQLGATSMREVIFWEIDYNLRIRTGKIMNYDMITGKRDKTGKGINWIHAKWKGRMGVPKDFNLKQCLFGEHLLNLFPLNPVAVVESEKTAIIGFSLFPEYIWVATGGKSNTDIMKMKVLKDRKVILFPDVDGYEKWLENAKTYDLCTVTVSDALEKYADEEDKRDKIDIADVFIEIYKEKNKAK